MGIDTPAPEELATVIRLVTELEPGVVNVGHGRDRASTVRAAAFLWAWTNRGGHIGRDRAPPGPDRPVAPSRSPDSPTRPCPVSLVGRRPTGCVAPPATAAPGASAGDGCARAHRATSDDRADPAVAPFPEWLGDLGRQAIAESYLDPERGGDYAPDVALINYYNGDARLGLHRDSDEQVLEPIVSLSLGAACVFRLGNTDNRGRPWTDLTLQSGDLLVFGDESRLAYHGVPKLLPDIDVPDIGLHRGRLNLTLRVTGLSDDPA